MHIENTKLKYNQTIAMWKGLHQHLSTNLAAHRGARMAFCHVLLLFNLSSLQEEFSV
jgi:hypothetical protein